MAEQDQLPPIDPEAVARVAVPATPPRKDDAASALADDGAPRVPVPQSPRDSGDSPPPDAQVAEVDPLQAEASVSAYVPPPVAPHAPPPASTPLQPGQSQRPAQGQLSPQAEVAVPSATPSTSVMVAVDDGGARVDMPSLDRSTNDRASTASPDLRPDAGQGQLDKSTVAQYATLIVSLLQQLVGIQQTGRGV